MPWLTASAREGHLLLRKCCSPHSASGPIARHPALHSCGTACQYPRPIVATRCWRPALPCMAGGSSAIAVDVVNSARTVRNGWCRCIIARQWLVFGRTHPMVVRPVWSRLTCRSSCRRSPEETLRKKPAAGRKCRPSCRMNEYRKLGHQELRLNVRLWV
jgi:hypothetical protein